MVKDPIANKVSDLARIHGLDKTNSWIRETVSITPRKGNGARADETERLLVLMRDMRIIDQSTFGSWMSQHLRQGN